jgi:hypothetical protein
LTFQVYLGGEIWKYNSRTFLCLQVLLCHAYSVESVTGRSPGVENAQKFLPTIGYSL